MNIFRILFPVFIMTFIISCNDKSHEKDNLRHGEKHGHDCIYYKESKDHECAHIKKTAVKNLTTSLQNEGYEVFTYFDEKTGDTIVMQKYFMVFLKRGNNTSQSEEELQQLQTAHLDHLGRMYDLGFADISGPFGDEGEIRGITIYNVPTITMADSLAKLDPMVKAGRLNIEVHPWWAAKGFELR